TVCCFFFQAEDGIRDKLVTGVQTCALPIYPCRIMGERMVVRIADPYRGRQAGGKAHRPVVSEVLRRSGFRRNVAARQRQVATTRSEERRVGKECSARRGTC